MNILIACEESQEVCKAMRVKGHSYMHCDLSPASGGHPEWHLMFDVRIPLSAKNKDGTCYWDMIIAHPPCTYLCNSGSRWLYEDCKTGTAADRWNKLIDGRDFFMLFYNHPCDKIVIENPVPHKHAMLPAFTQSIQPWQFGEPEKKRTCLWIKGLPKLIPTDIIPIQERKSTIHDMGWSKGGELRSKLRSKTFPLVAAAFADQWG